MPAAFLSSNKQDYATPWPLVEAVEKELGQGFTLDVCASAKSAKAPNYFTEAGNAFVQDWALSAAGGLAWCNPPYIDGWPGRFLRRARLAAAASGLTTVFLLPANKTDQGWWHDVVIPNHAVWDVKGRVDFLDPETGKVPKVWKIHKGMTVDPELVKETEGDPFYGRWVKQSNPQASKIVIVGPDFPACLPRSFIWK